MRFMEIANPEDQLALWRLISNCVWSELGKSPADPVSTSSSQSMPVVTPTMQPPRIKSQPKYRPKKKSTTHKVSKPKRAPMAPAPKPLPKPKPLTPTHLQTKKAQTQQHQQLASTFIMHSTNLTHTKNYSPNQERHSNLHPISSPRINRSTP